MSAIISGGQKLIDSTVAHAKHYSKELSDYNLLQKIDHKKLEKANPINLFKKRSESLSDKFKNENLYSF